MEKSERKLPSEKLILFFQKSRITCSKANSVSESSVGAIRSLSGSPKLFSFCSASVRIRPLSLGPLGLYSTEKFISVLTFDV